MQCIPLFFMTAFLAIFFHVLFILNDAIGLSCCFLFHYFYQEFIKYLSLVVLCVQEWVFVTLFNHLNGLVFCFVNNGEVEKPVEKQRRLLKSRVSKIL